MKALVYEKYGSPDYLEIREIAKPTPKNNEVLVKVHAVSINDWDWGLFQDNFMTRPGRIFSRSLKILGSDIAGRVESVGPDVKQFTPGDAVFGDLSRYIGGFGGFAEFVCASESQLAVKPDSMTFEQAAAIPQAGMLALQALAAGGPLKSGQRILINGAGGGVGTFAIQLAKVHNVEVTGVDSAMKLDMLRSLGFDHVIDYKTEDFTKSGKLYDLIVDPKTNRPASDFARVLNPGGTYATVGGTSHLGQFMALGPWLRRKYKRNFCLVMLKQNRDLPYLSELFEAGKFTPVIDGPYQFSEHEVRKAFRHFGAAEHKGKIVVTVANS
ncbi:MAG: NAD(P)-dependent alcohol dehydrogenase [Candidatus Obscuribacterales bacterium]|nr:NAD(P)-dependent alcohol dehydrogenase [Steroidobacteraceae bacterium]